jgi:putative ABC transport system permease protein
VGICTGVQNREYLLLLVSKALASVDSNLVLYSVDSYSKIVEADFQQQNMIATLTSLF